MISLAVWKRKPVKECNVVLSAGGIKALAHIGALEQLEAQGWKIKSICGISAGAIVASLYASGFSFSEMRAIATSTNFNDFKKLNWPCKDGFFKFNGLGNWVAAQCLSKDPSLRKCDLNIVACSLTSGNKKIYNNPFDYSTLSTAIEGTCSVPLVFRPIKDGDEYYVDGALWSSAPIHFYQDQKLPTICVNVQTHHVNLFTDLHKPIQLIYRVFEVFQINRLKGLKKRLDTFKNKVYMIEPDIDFVQAMDFRTNTQTRLKLIDQGKEAACLVLKSGIEDLNGNKIF